MRDIEVIIDGSMPPHAAYAAADGDTVRVTVAPDVEAAALAVLDQSIGLAIAEAVGREREARSS